MNATEQLQSLLQHRPFAVLGYSAEDSVWCPSCLRSAAGLSPARGADYDGKPIVPLYARDDSVHAESCDNCERLLLDILLEHDSVHLQHVQPVGGVRHSCGDHWTLSFDGAPPPEVRTQLKRSGWRWDSRYQLWWCTTEKPEIPARVALSPDYAPRATTISRPSAPRRPKVCR